ncbi:MAG TPA: hypothetical protein VFQ24_04115 [Terriglobia bacterium]|nr:hypothetical protein [Terriglobia bacterium]
MPPPQLSEAGSTKWSFACGRLKSRSACEASINDAAGGDSEQEQATARRTGLAFEALFDSGPMRIGAPCFIIEHIPLSMQQWHVQADWQGAAVPFTGSNIWKEPHMPIATSNVPKNPLITI